MTHNVYAESTPNPEVMKFVSNKIISKRNAEIKNINEATNVPLAVELFKLSIVKSIFIGSNFVSIKKKESFNWEDHAINIRSYISNYLNNSNIMDHTENIDLQTKSNKKEVKKGKEETEEVTKKISSILEEYIKPAVESDGGEISLCSFKNNIVTVDLKGACSGCPSSTTTLKLGIESLLKEKIDPNITVVANPS